LLPTVIVVYFDQHMTDMRGSLEHALASATEVAGPHVWIVERFATVFATRH